MGTAAFGTCTLAQHLSLWAPACFPVASREICVLFSSTFTIIYCALLEVHVLVFDRADGLL